MKCSVEGCNWEGYSDTKKCYAHSRGKEPHRQPDGPLESYPASGVTTFAEKLELGRAVEDEP